MSMPISSGNFSVRSRNPVYDELGCCGMLVEILILWSNKILHEKSTLLRSPLSQNAFSEECLAREWTNAELPNVDLWFECGLLLGCVGLCGTGRLWKVRPGHHPVR